MQCWSADERGSQAECVCLFLFKFVYSFPRSWAWAVDHSLAVKLHFLLVVMISGVDS